MDPTTERLLSVGLWFVASTVCALVCVLVGASLLRPAASWGAKLSIPYSRAFKTMAFAQLANIGTAVLCLFIVGVVTGGDRDAMIRMQAVLWPIGFLIQSAFIASHYKLSFARSCLVSLAMLAILAAIGVFIAVAVMIISVTVVLAGH